MLHSRRVQDLYNVIPKFQLDRQWFLSFGWRKKHENTTSTCSPWYAEILIMKTFTRRSRFLKKPNGWCYSHATLGWKRFLMRTGYLGESENGRWQMGFFPEILKNSEKSDASFLSSSMRKLSISQKNNCKFRNFKKNSKKFKI